MKLRKIVIFYVFLLFTSFSLSGQMIFTGDMEYSPVYYEPVYSLLCTSTRISLSGGARLNSIAIGITGYGGYLSLNGQDPDRTLKGAFFSAGGDLFVKWLINKSFSLEAGGGGYWVRTMLNYNDIGWLGVDQPGVSFYLKGGFFAIPDILELKIASRLNLNLNSYPENPVESLPLFKGGVLAVLHPGLDWLEVYAEASVIYWHQQNPMVNYNSVIPEVTLGVRLDFIRLKAAPAAIKAQKIKLPLTQLKKKLQAYYAAPATDMVEEQPPEEKLVFSSLVEPFIKARKGDKILLTNILFEQEDRIIDSSYPVLTEIAGYIKSESQLSIQIAGFSEPLGNPIEEFRRCTSRAEAIKEFLIKLGVEEGQIGISTRGVFVTAKDKEKDVHSKIVFTINEEKEDTLL